MVDHDEFEDDELAGDDYEGSHLDLNPSSDEFEDKDFEEGDDFEGTNLEYDVPPERFDEEDFEGDDFTGNEPSA